MDKNNAEHIINNSFNNQYEFIKFLGEGAFAQVWLVKHKFLDDKRAMKIIKETLDNSSNVQKVFHEVKIATQLRHKNIISIYDAGIITTYGIDEKGRYNLEKKENNTEKQWAYFVLEYVSGGDLEEYRQSFLKSDIQMPTRIVLDIIRQMLLGLDTLHSSNPPIIHRDLKTGNILLTYDNKGKLVIKISDFGFATDITSIKTDTDIAGTRPYMAPECFEKTFTTQTDIYAIGVILYLLLTNHFPYDADKYEIEDMINKTPWKNKLASPSIHNKNIPQKVEEILKKCLNSKPQQRYKDAKELLDEINTIIEDDKQEHNHRKQEETTSQIRKENSNVKKALKFAKINGKLEEAIEILEKEILKDYETRKKYSNLLLIWKSEHPDIKLVMKAHQITLKGKNYEKAIELLTEAIAYNPELEKEYTDTILLWQIFAKLEKKQNLFEAVNELEDLMNQKSRINKQYKNIINKLKTYSTQEILNESLKLKKENQTEDAAKLLEIIVITDKRIEKQYSYKLSLWKQNIEM